MLGLKLWYTGIGGTTTCTRCHSTVTSVASPYFGATLAGQSWCATCLRETGRDR